MIRRPPRSTQSRSSAASDVYKRQPHKAPGPDGFKPVLFRHLPMAVFGRIAFIYKACLHLHYTPKLWRETWVVFIPQPGKASYREAASFRPICLSNYLIKGLERLVTWRTQDCLVEHPIHVRQHGFQKGKCTETAISNTLDSGERHVMRDEPAVGMFLDISSAYDSVSINHIRASLYRHGVDEDYMEWYYHMIGHRVLDIHLHGCLLYTSPSPRD